MIFFKNYINTFELYFINILDTTNWLFYLINFPLVCMLIIFCLSFFKQLDAKFSYNLALYFSAISFVSSLFILLYLKQNIEDIQYEKMPFQLNFQLNISPLLDDSWLYFGIDFISLSLIILTNKI